MRRAALVLGLACAAFPAVAQNVLPDPSFTTGVGGWTAVGASPATIQWLASAGPDGLPGFARLQVIGPGTGFAQACVPVVGGQRYSWGASFFPRTAGGQVILDFYPNGSCAGLAIVGETFGPFATTTLAAWQFEPGPDVTAPATAGSVLFRLAGTVPSAGVGIVDVDNAYFGSQGTGPPGGRDVPALSGPLVLALAVALALLGARVLRSA